MKEFSHRFDFVNGKYLSIFLGGERAYGKIHPRKIDRNNRESTFFFFWSHSYMILFFDMESNLQNVLILKCVSIANKSVEH